MSPSESTCWTIIRDASRGCAEARERFARFYLPVIRAYLGDRWQGTRYLEDLDDALQEVFVECFREGGVLEKTDPQRPGGFRAFLYGVLRNVALRIEKRKAVQLHRESPGEDALRDLQTQEASLSRVFDRAWALAVIREAARLQGEQAATEPARRRHELLRLRFQENLPLRRIAELWKEDPARIHGEYRQAREEFKRALQEVLSFHHPGSEFEIQREFEKLMAILG